MKISKYSPIILFLFFALFSNFAFTQTEKGIELYYQGQFDAAIRELKPLAKKNPLDSAPTFYLGLSYFQIGKIKQARKEFEKLVKRNPENQEAHVGLGYVFLAQNNGDRARNSAKKALQINKGNFEAHYVLGLVDLREEDFSSAIIRADEAITLNPKFANAYLLRCDALTLSYGKSFGTKNAETNQRKLKEASEALEKFIALNSDPKGKKLREEQIESLRFFSDHYLKNENQPKDVSGSPAVADPTITPLQILYKQRPNYTDAARKAGVKGVVRLAVGFQSDGEIKHILVLKGLSQGLTEQAVYAARQIRFQPQMKDGKPVSVVRLVEFSFDIRY